MDYEYDVDSFSRKQTQAQPSNSQSDRIIAYQDALTLYKGHYLPFTDDNWASGGTGGTYSQETYTYDAQGRLDEMPGLGTYGYQDPNHIHAVTHISVTQMYWYDPNGNMITRTVGTNTFALAYNAENSLVSVSVNPASASESDGTVKSEQKISNSEGDLSATLGSQDYFGFSSTGIGDLNGDGVEDIVVGATLDDDGGSDRGAVYVLFLDTDGTVQSEQKISDTSGGLTATLDNSDLFGGSVASIGDLDGDGVNDIVVGAYNDDGAFNAGAVYILSLYGFSPDTTYAYNGDGLLVLEATGVITTVYIGNYFEYEISDTQTISRSYYYAGSQRVAVRENGTLHYFLRDNLGSTSLTLDVNWDKVAELRYKPCPPAGMLREGEVRYSWGSQVTDYCEASL